MDQKTSKTCTQCGEEKPLHDFPNNPRAKDGKRANCKDCQYAITMAWNRSPKGVAIRLWHKHTKRSVERGHPQPDYDKEWLVNFVMTHSEYPRLYDEYVKSDYDKYKCPSIDRLDDNVGYRKDNIRLVSFQENMDHCYDAARKAEHTNAGWVKGCMSPHRAIVQLSLSGSFIAEYISVNEAARSVRGADNSKIPACCQGKRKSHAGFQWVYREDYYSSDFEKKDLTLKSINKKAKPVAKYDKNGERVAFFNSATEAAESGEGSCSSITRCARGERGWYRGYEWRYV